MATQVISFRASGSFLDWLQTQQLDNESLSQAAQRLLKEQMGGTENPDVKTVSTPKSTIKPTTVDTIDRVDIEDIAKGYYAQAMSQTNAAIAQLREELLGELRA